MAASQKQGGGGGSLYYEIANFQAGMDLRKSELTAPAGTLRLLQNAHITQGGEIEKRAKFDLWCNAPAGSIGICAVDDKVYTHVFSGTPGVIDEPTDTTIGVIHIAPPIGSIVLAGANITDGITDPPIAGTVLYIADLTTYDGSSTTITVGMKVNGTGVAEGTVITSDIDGGGGPGNYYVNNSQLSYPSSLDGHPTGETPIYQLCYDIFNGRVFAVFGGPTTNSYAYYDGVQATEANGTPGSEGGNGQMLFVRTYKEKMYALVNRQLVFSSVGDPTIWYDPGPDVDGNIAHNGTGFIDVGTNDADSQLLLSMEVYYDKMAIFSRLSCQLWFLDPDPSLNQYFQTLRDAGTIAPTSVRQYVANDVYFLGTHGIRSLRARDLTTTAAVADVGSPIDAPVQDLIATDGPFELNNILYWTRSVLDARTGRFWIASKNTIYILSNWASPNISAWSVYIPEFTIDNQHILFSDPYVVIRTTTGAIMRFGSSGALAYDSCPVQFTTPFLSFDKPATFKFYQGFDAICSNVPGSVWSVKASFDPTRTPTPFDQICTLDGPSIMDGKIPISGRGTHVMIDVTHAAPGPATFSKLFIHYAPSDTS
jgi:hypothetical protein